MDNQGFGLECFMNPVSDGDTWEGAISERYCDASGEPMQWKLKAIDGATDTAIRKKCRQTRAVPGGKRGQTEQVFDGDAYALRMAAACVVYPNLNAAELQNHYGVMTDYDVLAKMLLPGELAGISDIAGNLCGFDLATAGKATEAEDIEAAKN